MTKDPRIRREREGTVSRWYLRRNSLFLGKNRATSSRNAQGPACRSRFRQFGGTSLNFFVKDVMYERSLIVNNL